MKTVLFLLAFVPGLAFAHGSRIKMVSDSTQVALDKFESEEAAAASTFTGVKSWVNGDQTKVRVYFNDNQDSIYYTCTMNHGGGQEVLDCVKD